MLSEAPPNADVRRFRTKLLVAMALVVAAITATGLYYAEQKVAAETEHDLQRDFQLGLTSLHGVQEVRHAALAERCRALVERPRIHAALEDNALDLLYPSAHDELRDLMEDDPSPDAPPRVLRARFYRFLDAHGAVIPAAISADVGELSADESAAITLRNVPDQQQLGYLRHRRGDREWIDEVIAMPIISTETGEIIAALVVGFKPVEMTGDLDEREFQSGIWLAGHLILPTRADPSQPPFESAVTAIVANSQAASGSSRVSVNGSQQQLFFKRLNPDSLFPPAYEVCLYPLTDLLARQRALRWEAGVASTLLMLGGVMASRFLAVRLAKPVEQLAVDSEENRTQRAKAEAALEITSEELQRAARFSADASHQLKTPVTVLRAGLEGLLSRESLTTDECNEVSALIHQTYRLTGIVEDLLLLSRMDAGRLSIEFSPVNLSQLLDAWVDDLGAQPGGRELAIETDFPASLHIAGEKRYASLILQNLFENARKYNRPGGRIRISAKVDGEWVLLTIGNTGRSIPPAAQDHVFERFHRGIVGENVPGHGLGLNLARELARIHRGDLRLVHSGGDWTEFELRFRLAHPAEVGRLSAA